MTDLVPVRRALLSVSDKTGLDPLAKGLVERGVELVSTGGTAAKLRESGGTVRDVSDLTGDHAGRWQRWASCFEPDFSYMHGGSVRQSGASRYRQWFSHKLGTWHDQFGSSGCVGCGRCIAWCPVGIDITAEAASLAELAQQAEEERE